MKKQERSVVIEMAATMLKAGIDYALEHQAELFSPTYNRGQFRE